MGAFCSYMPWVGNPHSRGHPVRIAYQNQAKKLCTGWPKTPYWRSHPLKKKQVRFLTLVICVDFFTENKRKIVYYPNFFNKNIFKLQKQK